MSIPVYVVMVRFDELDANRITLVDHVLSSDGSDWFRFNGVTWLLASNTPLGTLNERLKVSLRPLDSFIVMRVDPQDYVGSAPPETWNWLRRVSQTNALLSPFVSTGLLPNNPNALYGDGKPPRK